jgi:hypothetical protein
MLTARAKPSANRRWLRLLGIVGERLQSRAKVGGLSLINSPRPQVNATRLKVAE